MPIYNDIKTIFVHIPKNGGSTATTLLKRDRFWGRKSRQIDPRGEGRETLSEFLEVLGGDAVDYFSFSFVRNPWDRFVSAYHYICQRRPQIESVTSHKSFEDFVDVFGKHPERFLKIRYFQPQWEFLEVEKSDKPISFLGRFENYDEDFSAVLKEIGLDRKFFRHRKKTRRSDYREYFNTNSKSMIAEVYSRDIEQFSYNFDSGQKRKRASFLKATL
ncbi:Sulfotransferase family protein [Falsiruegeria litorea R37]|uniref:Sulfotransferase family protein n=1 Tax=Falsiruegeria litorea R37 TaxID=1200284 RepID=A0A1Y5RLI6_9RHOB|nr:sulfotransferase family 2 domain-containing protein [Falsiruegeria litorea]SLN19880.1 Sulfotransferase family protein [Falsiruegeria litorea R37]